MTPRGLANARPGGGLGDTPSPPAWWHLYTPLAGRPAPRPGTRRPGFVNYGSLDSRKESYACPRWGLGDTSRPPAWRPLNHGLLRGQLAGRGQHSRPELRDCGSPDSRKGDGSFVCAARRTQGKLPGQRARRRTARVATAPRCGKDRRPVP